LNSDLLRDGDYALKQIFCRSRIVAWSHGSRFDLARRLVEPAAGGRLLDYGCGDGTFIAMVHASFTESLGVDVDPGQIGECAARLGQLPNVRFGLTRDLPRAEAGGWDAVTCMEVLEHCLETERRRVLDELRGLASPRGFVVVSVPIEVGPSLAGKQFFRALAGLRRLGDYAHRERYSASEMAKSVMGWPLVREVFTGSGPNGPYLYHGHKGFDFRVLEREFRERFIVAERLFTPIRWLGPVLNSQVWLIGRPR
jgi:2-polyprenyl-3-methyl-5-hydroxy-6-metoxy-1,4-benzoquinol methylase